MSATCLFVYDYFTTFSDEVDFIWKARCGPGKLLFLLVRYVTWPELLSLIYIHRENAAGLGILPEPLRAVECRSSEHVLESMTGLREDPRPRVLHQLHELPGLRSLPDDTESGCSWTRLQYLIYSCRSFTQ